MDGAEALLETLSKQGVKHCFGYPGGAVIPIYDKLLEYSDKIKHILVRHEQGAAHAADAYARVSGKAGVCFATSGPGATNLVTGIMTAFMDSSPVIAFGGQVPVSLLGNDAFQESDMFGVTMPITKHNYQIRSADNLIPVVNNAFRIATSGRPGPVYIDLPKNVQTDKVTDLNRKIELPGYKPVSRGHPVQIKKAAEMILASERPVILAGGGTLISNAHNEVAKLSELLSIPVATTFMAKGVFPESHPLSLGILGMHGRKVANYAIANSDLVIAIGCRFSDRITGNIKTFAENSKIIHIDIDSAEIGKNIKADLPVVGDAKFVLADIVAVVEKKLAKGNSPWAEKMKKMVKECDCNLDSCKDPIDPKKVLLELRKVLSDTDIVATGVGQHQMFAGHFLRREKPRTFISSGGAGTMGFGLPAAVGAKVAKPDVNVIDFDGDGSFTMTIQELATCKQNNIAITPVIMNNGYLGMVRQWLELFYDKRYSAVTLDKNLPDFAKLATAFGLEGITVEKCSELSEAFKRALKNDVTTVVNVLIEGESNILPMFAAGANIYDQFGDCVPKRYFER